MIFNRSIEYLKEKNAWATAREIAQQPSTWKKTFLQIQEDYQAKKLASRYVNNPQAFIVFTGAGSSEFVGNALVPLLRTSIAAQVASIATTDLLTDVSTHLKKDTPTLLVSFGRSGNSPESIGAVEVAQNHCRHIDHLFITCNSKGTLAGMQLTMNNVTSVLLSEETHDESFAMTSSFSNMFLAAALLFLPDALSASIDPLSDGVEHFLASGYRTIEKVVDYFEFDRIVYLGSGHLKGIAQESALKILELTAGKVASLYDTFLGFRHGPKSFLSPSTLTVMYLSPLPKVRRYELDLLKEMSAQSDIGKILLVDTMEDELVASMANDILVYPYLSSSHLAYTALSSIVVAQTIGLFKSLSEGKTPDNPFPSGSVNRVVQGVTLYLKEEEV